MKWNPRNREWYQGKGYIYTKWHNEFEVFVGDLTSNSLVEIILECDYCKEKFNIEYRNLVKLMEKDKTGKHSCVNCTKLRLAENKLLLKTSNVSISESPLEKIVSVEIENEKVFLKKCKLCCRFKDVDCFRKNTRATIMEYYNTCNECEKEFAELNRPKTRLLHIKTSSNKMCLPVPLTIFEMEKINDYYESRCALTDSINIVYEHFIPVSWGHGGTYKGNIYLLSNSMNLSKGDQNPFRWIRKVEDKIIKGRWNKLVRRLAALNGLTIKEFEDYVYWCEKNKRTREDNLKDNRLSIDQWRNSIK